MNAYFVTGIGTGVGKTLISAILVEALKADYWKPIQAGDLKNTDSQKVKALISNKKSVIHPEAYKLSKPLSPHAAAKIDEIKIELKNIKKPKTSNTLIIEGAGGVLVPINNNLLMIDLMKRLKAKVVIVSSNYLGSINHTLLTVEALKGRNIPLEGIIFNGKPNRASEEIILNKTKLKCLARVKHHHTISPEIVKINAAVFSKNKSK